MHIHAYHIGTAVIGIIGVAMFIFWHKFLRECLSEANEKGAIAGSHKRLIAFMFATTICICEVFHTFKQGKLDFQHLVAFLIAALLYSGIATVAQVMTIWKGNTSSATIEEKKTSTVIVQNA